MSNNLDQYHTPYEKGYLAGLAMAQGDPAIMQELETMTSNPNMDKDFHNGLVAGCQKAMYLLSAKDNEVTKKKIYQGILKWGISKKERNGFDRD